MVRAALLRRVFSHGAQVWTVASSSIDATPAVTRPVTRFSQGGGAIKVGARRSPTPSLVISVLPSRRTLSRRSAPTGLLTALTWGSAAFRIDDRSAFRSRDACHAAAAFDNETPGCSVQFHASGGWSLTFDMPRVLLGAPKAPITGEGGIEEQITWQAENDTGAGYGLRVTLVNNIASYA